MSAAGTLCGSISAEFKERYVGGSGLGTVVLEKRQGSWQIVHWHTSSPPRGPASAGAPKKD